MSKGGQPMAGLKNNMRLGLVLSLLSATQVHAGDAIPAINTSIKIDNHLSACIKISHQSSFEEHGIWFARIQYNQSTSIASCGCKSSISAYSSNWQTKDNKGFLMKGNLLFGKAGTIDLPLSMNPILTRQKTTMLTFSCAEAE